MSTDWFTDVTRFHLQFGCPVGGHPAAPPQAEKNFREDLIREEFDELVRAMDADNLPGVADALADLIYVSIGTAVSYGINLKPVWDRVHESNMAKVGGERRGDGKIGKPAGWVPPDVAGALRDQGWDGGR